MYLRGVADYAAPGEFENWQRDWIQHVQTYVTHAPVLDSPKLIRQYINGIKSLSADRQDSVRKIRLLIDMSKPHRAKTSDAEVAIATGLSKALEMQAVSMEEQRAVLSYMRRDLPNAPSGVLKSSAMHNLLVALRARQRGAIAPALLPAFQALCSAMVDDDKVANHDTEMKNAIRAVSKDDGKETKDWALSLFDQISKKVKVDLRDTSRYPERVLCDGIYTGKFSSSVHQQKIVEILERLLDSRDPIDAGTRAEILTNLRSSIRENSIDGALIPRFEDIISRVKNMEVADEEEDDED
jgi:hypothetical protein